MRKLIGMTIAKELSKLTKSTFDINDAINSASELKYVGGIKALLKKPLKSPDEDFIRYFFRNLCPENNFRQLKEDFFGYTLRGIKEFITEEIKHLLDDAVNPPEPDRKAESNQDPESEEKSTEFTEDEREGYYITRAILSLVVSPSRITYRDTVGYCNILLDNNGRRQIARFYFNNPENKRLEIFSMNADGNKTAETFAINNLSEIHEYGDQFKKIVISYEQPKVVQS